MLIFHKNAYPSLRFLIQTDPFAFQIPNWNTLQRDFATNTDEKTIDSKCCKQTFGKDLKTDVRFYNLTSFKHFKTASLLTTAYLLYLIDSCSPDTTQSG